MSRLVFKTNVSSICDQKNRFSFKTQAAFYYKTSVCLTFCFYVWLTSCLSVSVCLPISVCFSTCLFSFLSVCFSVSVNFLLRISDQSWVSWGKPWPEETSAYRVKMNTQSSTATPRFVLAQARSKMRGAILCINPHTSANVISMLTTDWYPVLWGSGRHVAE